MPIPAFALLLIGLTAGLAVMQVVYVVAYLRGLSGTREDLDRPRFRESPRAAVILCLRGVDPGLETCLAHLIGLDYPNYELHLVFDHDQDPACQIAARLFNSRFAGAATPLWFDPGDISPRSSAGEERPRVVFHRISDHGTGRSLKCSALITTIMELSDEVEVIALVDADAIVEPDWLRLLVEPLGEESVGAVTGNRWFAPEAGLGGMVRKIWNAAALPQMNLYQIAWGGSLAINRRTLERLELLDRWSVAFCEDTMLSTVLGAADLQVRRVPELILVNRESTTPWDAFRWIRRQLLTVRLYHAAWPWVVLHAMVGGICLVGLPLSAMVLGILGQWWAVVWLMLAWVGLQCLNLVLVEQIEHANWLALGKGDSRPEHRPDPGLSNLSPTGLLANLMLQLAYPMVVLGTVFMQRVRWRGITYQLGPKGRIEMHEYRPFASNRAKATDQSIE